MSDFHTKKCDNCGKIKLESNGWWMIGVTSLKGLALTIVEPPVDERFVESWSKLTEGLESNLLDLCGHTCVIEKISKLIGGRKHGSSGAVGEYINQGR